MFYKRTGQFEVTTYSYFYIYDMAFCVGSLITKLILSRLCCCWIAVQHACCSLCIAIHACMYAQAYVCRYSLFVFLHVGNVYSVAIFIFLFFIYFFAPACWCVPQVAFEVVLALCHADICHDLCVLFRERGCGGFWLGEKVRRGLRASQKLKRKQQLAMFDIRSLRKLCVCMWQWLTHRPFNFFFPYFIYF